MATPIIPPAHAARFLDDCGWSGARIEPLAGDASFRRYFRVIGDGRSAVLMDAPPPHEDPRPFVAVAEWLASTGLSAPEILHRDLDKGMLLLADFGDARLRETVDADPASERGLYELATDLLVHLHNHPPMPVRPCTGSRPGSMNYAVPDCIAGLDLGGRRDIGRVDRVLEPVSSYGWAGDDPARLHAENVCCRGPGGRRSSRLLDFQTRGQGTRL